jgi:hypothetical protein
MQESTTRREEAVQLRTVYLDEAAEAVTPWGLTDASQSTI